MPNSLTDAPSGATEMSEAIVSMVATTALVMGGLGVLFNSDVVARKIYKPDALYSRRDKACRYRLKKKVLSDMVEMSKDVSKVMNEEHLDKLVASIVVPGTPSPDIIGICQDMETLDFFVVLNVKENPEYGEFGMLKVPLAEFGLKLAAKFERIVTSTTLCFVADASSGLGPVMLSKILKGSTDVAVIDCPAWMVSLALVIETNTVQAARIDKALFALCRMEARRHKDQIKDSRTVVFNLPGQAVVPALLPILQRVFPCERHVFVYDGCAASTSRAMASAKGNLHGDANELLYTSETAFVSIGSAIGKTRGLKEKLAMLPANMAGPVRSWMGSVDCFLKMKDDEKSNGYLPFVLRLGFLLGRTDGIGNGDKDLSDVCLLNAMQYITGTRSRPLKEETINAANDALKLAKLDILGESVSISKEQRVQLEACVFCHKGILIGDKTLLDTVQPMKDWSLKAAKKLQSCACCAPEEDDNPGPEDDVSATPGAFAPSMSRKPGYVDGKVSFAFDPTKFNKPG